MNKSNFPFLALGLGIILFIGLMLGSQPGADGDTGLPLLTLLILSEFGMILTAIGAFLGIQSIMRQGFSLYAGLTTAGCVLLAIAFLRQGIEHWPL